MGFQSGYVEIFQLLIDRKSKKVAVVQHASAVITARPYHLGNGVEESVRYVPFGHAIVMRILVNDRGDCKRAEELANSVLAVAYADVLAEPQDTGPVGGMRISGDKDGRVAAYRNAIEWIDEVAYCE